MELKLSRDHGCYDRDSNESKRRLSSGKKIMDWPIRFSVRAEAAAAICSQMAIRSLCLPSGPPSE
jgi:hypothetical protein